MIQSAKNNQGIANAGATEGICHTSPCEEERLKVLHGHVCKQLLFVLNK